MVKVCIEKSLSKANKTLNFSKLFTASLFLIASFFLASCYQKEQLPEGDPDNGGLFIPGGFEAVVVADSVGPARHLAVSKNGDIYVKLTKGALHSGNVALRDVNNDGKADSISYFGDYQEKRGYGPTAMRIYNDYLYFSTRGAIYRNKLTPGKLVPESRIELVLTDDYKIEHIAKPLAFDDNGHMYVGFGSISNVCQVVNREPGSLGQDPCAELAEHAGVWRFDANKTNQTKQDGIRYATGIRSIIAMDWNHKVNDLFALQHGRDDLNRTWPSLYTAWQNAMLPSEEFFKVEEGMDGGWPYYYYDQIQNKKLLSPEYGGDGKKEGNGAVYAQPLIGFPGHWAPNDLLFYTGNQFPERYKNGAFIAFHGSAGRTPYPQSGYFICFVPFSNGAPSGPWEIFADGFAGKDTIVSSNEAVHRPMGLAMGPDGSLYISDDVKGKIWRVMFKGDRKNFGMPQLAEMEKRKSGISIKTPDEVGDNLATGMAAGGEKIYNTYCISCHQANGKGDGARFPPLDGSEWVNGDKEKLINVVLEGLSGPITVKGQSFTGVMPAHDFMSDAEIAKVLTYIRLSFTSNSIPVLESEVAKSRRKLNISIREKN
ncbi:MAG: c-type cytochrome [Chitinophagaceae bacterium]|nr:c-type cytochrome [Chitinophagaceae bacterium]